MGYYASYGGSLTPRDGKTKEEIEKALEFESYYENKNGAIVLSYEISGDGNYHEEDFVDLARTFDGQVDFVGENDARWSLFLKDGKVRETSPLEFLPKPGETPEQTIGRCIAERGLNIRQILESMPDFVAAKLWVTEDVTNKMSEMDIDDETQKAILPEAVNLINKKQLEECTDSEWDAIETGIEDALKELGKEFKVSGITLLTEEEAKALPKEQRAIGETWWLRSPGHDQDRAAFVYYSGGLDYFYVSYSIGGVRPALNLESSNLKIGDRVEIAGYKWTAIAGDKVLCDTIVGETHFRKNANTPGANDYEKSDIKKWLEKWAKDMGVIV